MPRKGEVPKRKVLPDPKYTDAPVDMRRRLTKFVNVVMRDGKKSPLKASSTVRSTWSQSARRTIR